MFDLLRKDIKKFEEQHGAGLFPKIYYPMFSAVVIFRLQCYLYRYKFFRPLSYLCVRINDFFHGIWIGPRVKVGGGLFLAHARGLIVNPETIIGENCTILQHVTIGGPGVIIGDDVLIGAGAKIISRRHVVGGLKIGSKVKVGAGAIVMNDVVPGATVVGNLARVI